MSLSEKFKWPERLIPAAFPVHHLHHGFAACAHLDNRLQVLPCYWPAGHRWSSDWSDVNCLKCLAYKPRKESPP